MEFKTLGINPFEISVRYSYLDYYRAVADHAPQVVRDLGKKSPRWVTRRVIPLIACGAALWTGKLRPHYQFHISNESLIRRSNASELKVPWSDVKRVRIYSASFMVEIEKGALVLPFRFFTAEKLRAFRGAVS